MAEKPSGSCELHGPRGALSCRRCRAKILASLLGGILGLVAWVVAVSATWLVAVMGPHWPEFDREWGSIAELRRDVMQTLSWLPAAILEGEYGYQFAMLSAYLWIGVGAIAAYLAATGKWKAFRLRSQLAAVLVVGLMIGSVRWLVSEVARVDRLAGAWSGGHFFEHGVAQGPLIALAVVVLVLILRANRRVRPGETGRSGP
ncbi:hypothetical protein [Tautonia plasticadhaerens]|uniref:Uncharacterized protein n=1 Tax=Tautonia plasticadhaerens TaxID=2527974 RepID=A0A518HE88_9BACT|nr:hypothetical protein [Tautonia plasticadhaerens]QDV39056.1 hypothetical protein ElP_70190 [Tautonia plasticadhaerens]